MSTQFIATYKAPADASESIVITAQWHNDHACPEKLVEVISLCVDLGVDADLHDAAGFPRGVVRADGSYKLT